MRLTARPRLNRGERKAETRARLLQAGARVFARDGFHDASLDTIAEVAGYSKGAVYSNFATKDELFVALIDQEFPVEPGPLDRDRTLLLLEFVLYAARRPKVRRQVLARQKARLEAAARAKTKAPVTGKAQAAVALMDGVALHRLLEGRAGNPAKASKSTN